MMALLQSRQRLVHSPEHVLVHSAERGLVHSAEHGLVHSVERGLVNHRFGLPLITPILKLQIIIPYSSSSTPTAPYSTADILYGSEVNGNRVPQNDDIRQNSFGDLDRSRDSARQKSRELEQSVNNRRPSSKSGKQKSLTIDSGMFNIVR